MTRRVPTAEHMIGFTASLRPQHLDTLEKLARALNCSTAAALREIIDQFTGVDPADDRGHQLLVEDFLAHREVLHNQIGRIRRPE